MFHRWGRIPYVDRMYVCEFGAAPELRDRFRANKAGLSPLLRPPSPTPPRPTLTNHPLPPQKFFFWHLQGGFSLEFFVRRWFQSRKHALIMFAPLNPTFI